MLTDGRHIKLFARARKASSPKPLNSTHPKQRFAKRRPCRGNKGAGDGGKEPEKQKGCSDHCCWEFCRNDKAASDGGRRTAKSAMALSLPGYYIRNPMQVAVARGRTSNAAGLSLARAAAAIARPGASTHRHHLSTLLLRSIVVGLQLIDTPIFRHCYCL